MTAVPVALGRPQVAVEGAGGAVGIERREVDAGFGALLDPNTDITGTLSMWGLRVFVGPGLHIIFSALAGWGLGQAVFTAGKSTAWRLARAGGWLFVGLAQLGWAPELALATTVVATAGARLLSVYRHWTLPGWRG